MSALLAVGLVLLGLLAGAAITVRGAARAGQAAASRAAHPPAVHRQRDLTPVAWTPPCGWPWPRTQPSSRPISPRCRWRARSRRPCRSSARRRCRCSRRSSSGRSGGGVEVDSRIESGRSPRDALQRLLEVENFDRIVVPASYGSEAGFSPEDVAWILDRVPGEVMVFRGSSEDEHVIAAAPLPEQA